MVLLSTRLKGKQMNLTSDQQYGELFQIAEHQQITGSIEDALATFKEASDIARTPEETTTCRQKIGVCLTNLGQLDEAWIWLVSARTLATVLQTGNIARDQARILWKSQEFDKAKTLLDESFRLLPIYLDPAGFGATLGFYGRVALLQGDFDNGLKWLGLADAILAKAGNRHFEMNNLLWLGCAFALSFKPFEAIQCARRAKVLIQQGYGGREQIQRAEFIWEHAHDRTAISELLIHPAI